MLSDAELEALLDSADGSLVPVAQPFTGRVLEVHVDVGDRVHDGTLLVVVKHGPPPGEVEPVHAASVNDAEVARVLVRSGDLVVVGQHVLWVRDVEPLADVRRALLDEAIERLQASPADASWRALAKTLHAVRDGALGRPAQDAGGADATRLCRPAGRPRKAQETDGPDSVRTAVNTLTFAGEGPLPNRLRGWLAGSLADLGAALAGGRSARHRALEAFGRRAGAGRPRSDPTGAKDPVAVAAAVALLAQAEGKARAVQRVADAVRLDESAVWAACHEVHVVDLHSLVALAEPALQRIYERKDSPFGPVPKLAELFPVT
jgi:pyruvate/2-oxoglutarate dehydrogenase complex dihydrolipoamide acyltransferase (E2) component